MDRLIASLDIPDRSIDEIRRNEIEKRVQAYEEGTVQTLSVEEVMAKYNKK